jgi:hypothetical protein
VYDYSGQMKFIREHWRMPVAAVWSVVAVVELVKEDYWFGAVATLFAIAAWDSYRRDRRSRAHQALEASKI